MNFEKEYLMISVVAIVENMDFIRRRLYPVYNMFVCAILFVNFVNDIPQNQHVHFNSWTSVEENTALTTEWINPCGATEPSNESGIRPSEPRVLRPLKDSLPDFIVRLQAKEMNAIDTSDISEWFNLNSTYSFLHQISAMSNSIQLRKRHLETQIYVGAFQHLAYNQKKYDTLHNYGNEVTIEIQLLLALAKNLLCEMETAIKRSTRQPIKTIFTREQMDKLLTFRNNNSINKYSGEVDVLDNKFVKVRFHEYVRDLQRLLNRTGKNNLELSSTHKSQGNSRENL